MTTGEGKLPAAVLVQSKHETDQTVHKLAASLRDGLGDRLGVIFGDHTTFILTGSGGRGEMTDGSDVDGYVVRVRGEVDADDDAEVLEATRAALAEVGLPGLDRNGEFLAMKASKAVIGTVGSKEDDHSDTFTLRMLFLLESRALLGQAAYDELFKLVSGVYRKSATQHTEDFLPFFLVNDIIRYWRTVLLNHEDRLRQKEKDLNKEGLSGDGLERVLLAHRRYRAQKLRFPRCLSCFSALGYFLAVAPSDKDAITGAHERRMFDLTPVERLREIATKQPRVRDQVHRMLDLYGEYMERTKGDKKVVLNQLEKDQEFRDSTSKGGQDFTREMFQLIQELGQGNRLHRQMLI